MRFARLRPNRTMEVCLAFWCRVLSQTRTRVRPDWTPRHGVPHVIFLSIALNFETLLALPSITGRKAAIGNL